MFGIVGTLERLLLPTLLLLLVAGLLVGDTLMKKIKFVPRYLMPLITREYGAPFPSNLLSFLPSVRGLGGIGVV